MALFGGSEKRKVMAAADCDGLSQQQQQRLNDVMATRLGFKALAEDGTAAILAGP
jgi:hypothetical protein